VGKRRIELSGTKVTANVLATVTGATAASRFGVAGTLAGTVVMSLATTAGTGIYQYYLNRGGDKVRAIHPPVPSRTQVLQGGPAGDSETVGSGAGHGTADGAGTFNGGGNGAGMGDGGRTANGGATVNGSGTGAVPAEVGSRHLGDGADEGTGNGQATAPWPTLVHFPSVSGGFPSVSGGLPSVSGGSPAGSGGSNAAPGGNGSPGSNVLGRFPWRETNWKRIAVVAAVTFVLAIAVISLIELVAGRPLGSIIGGQHASGTSIGNVLGHHPSTGKPQSPSRPGSSAPASTPAQPAHTGGPGPARSRPAAPSPVPTAPASRPTIGGGGGTGSGASRAPTP
jgi:hypothetical protein